MVVGIGVDNMLYGGIEAGGTKFICAIADEFEVIEKISIDTRTPSETMAEVIRFFSQYELAALGIGCFGPIDVNMHSKTYGYILQTPKLAWQQYDFLGTLKAHFNIPMYWQTDVNVAAFGEMKLGAARTKQSCVYLTIGTGVGGGYVTQDGFVPTLLHAEMGHIYLKRLEGDTFTGNCPFHHDCLEGLVSGPAIEKRVGQKAYDLTETDEIWTAVASYIAQALVNYTFTLSPEIIILGGGVMGQTQLLSIIQSQFEKYVAGYIDFSALNVNITDYITAPGLENNSGILGALALAKSLV